MSKYLDSYINFEIYNVQSRNELNRIVHFIKVFMKLYEKFIKKELNSGNQVFWVCIKIGQ